LEIELCGYLVQVDPEDKEMIQAFAWHSTDQGNGLIYFVHTVQDGNKSWNIYLHRFIVGVRREEKYVVDHISGDHLDNRKANLRICTHAENMRNQRLRKSSRTGFKGVCYNTGHKKYRAQIVVNQKYIHLGYFDFPAEAHKAYCKAAVQYHGEYANFG